MKKRGKRIAAVFLAAAMTMLPVGTAYGEEIQNGAEPATDDPAARREQEREADFRMKFDPTLVRGMSYYTGTIFEISMDEFGGSVGGGGRYDKMIGKFTGQDTPAVGFSIGFERIVMLLLERGYQVPTSRPKKAYLLEKKISREKLLEVLDQAKAERAAGNQVMIMNMKKNKKFQKEQLAEQGYTDITEVYNG